MMTVRKLIAMMLCWHLLAFTSVSLTSWLGLKTDCCSFRSAINLLTWSVYSCPVWGFIRFCFLWYYNIMFFEYNNLLCFCFFFHHQKTDCPFLLEHSAFRNPLKVLLMKTFLYNFTLNRYINQHALLGNDAKYRSKGTSTGWMSNCIWASGSIKREQLVDESGNVMRFSLIIPHHQMCCMAHGTKGHFR